jgi:ABC-type sugar transport system substrate-binding protein
MHTSTTARKRVLIGVSAFATAALMLAGCSSPKATGSTSAKTGLTGKTVALVGYGDASPWGAYYNKIYEAAIKKAGGKLVDLTTMDAGTQVQNMNQAVSEHPDVIVTMIWDTAAMAAPIRKASEAGVPVIVVDGPADPSVAHLKGVYSVLSDNVALGKDAATNIVDGLKAQGKTSGNIIAITGTTSMLITQQRMQGFNSVLSKNPGFKLIDKQDSNWDPTKAGTIASQLLAKYGPDGVQGAYGMADYLAVPIVNAATQLGFTVGGKTGLVVSGGNCFKAGIDAIKAGTMYGTATEDPGTVATKSADYTEKFLDGKKVPQVLTIKEYAVNASNLDKFAALCSNA